MHRSITSSGLSIDDVDRVLLVGVERPQHRGARRLAWSVVGFEQRFT
ncbi:MAG: hypothetical protein ACKVHU_21395 [Acidimicrobiales bacterium]|jgi:hypothetical protein